MRLATRSRAALGILCLSLATATAAAASPLEGGVPAVRAEHEPAPAPAPSGRPAAKGSDPMLAAFLGAIPLASGYYLTSAPRKGIAFTVADAVIIGSIWNIRRERERANRRPGEVPNPPDRDVTPYFALLGAVNLADACLSLWQARTDEAARIRVTLNASGKPVLGLAWNF